MSFPQCDSEKRMDDNFFSVPDEDVFLNASDEEDTHIIGVSPLLQLNVKLISMFPLDYMHLVHQWLVYTSFKCPFKQFC